MRTCPICGAAALALSDKPVCVEFRDRSYNVGGFKYEVCGSCGERLHPAGQFDAILRTAVAKARRDQGLLTPDEIRGLRSKLGLTQTELEQILGVGPKSVTRWEKGTVFQSAVADKFMRLILTHPELLGVSGQPEFVPCSQRYDQGCYEVAKEDWAVVKVEDNDLSLAA